MERYWEVKSKDTALKLFKVEEVVKFLYSETLNNEYIKRIHQMSYSSLSDVADI